MQKVINVLALLSFATSATIVGAGAYVYVNRDAIKAQAEEQIKEAIGSAIGGQLGSTLLSGEAMDPVQGMDETGAIPIPSLPF